MEQKEAYTGRTERLEQEPPEKPMPTVRLLPPVRVEIDIAKLEIYDIILMDEVTSGQPYQIIEVVRMMERLIEGGTKGRPITQYHSILSQILAVVKELANPKGEG